jgi:hypothetical protein
VVPGQYRVSATWTPHPNRATNSPFTILDGVNVVSTVAINQEQAPNDFHEASSFWEDLGGPYLITSNSLQVRLSDAANQIVVADAIRIERLA